MAEASKALSTFHCAGGLPLSLVRGALPPPDATSAEQQRAPAAEPPAAAAEACGESSSAVAATRTNYFSDGSLSSTHTRASSPRSSQRGALPPPLPPHRREDGARGGPHVVAGLRLSFVPDSHGWVPLVRGGSVAGSSVTTSATAMTGATAARKSPATMSSAAASSASKPSRTAWPAPSATSPGSPREESSATTAVHAETDATGAPSAVASRPSTPPAPPASPSKEGHDPLRPSSRRGSGRASPAQAPRPIRVSFVPLDLDVPLEEQHGGTFDVVLHKMTEDIVRAGGTVAGTGTTGTANRGGGGGGGGGGAHTGGSPPAAAVGEAGPGSRAVVAFEAAALEGGGTDHHDRALRRLQRLRAYKQRAPSCVFVDPPENILTVMSRADMAEALSRCLVGVKTKGGVPVTTPRFCVLGDDGACDVDGFGDATSSTLRQPLARTAVLAAAGLACPLIAKPLVAAGTSASHRMGVVLATDGLAQLRTPCLLQEYANHGGILFKVYVLGEAVWVFARESLPDLPMGNAQGRFRPREESFVELASPAGRHCYVEFNSQRPYPCLTDFGIGVAAGSQGTSAKSRENKDVRNQRSEAGNGNGGDYGIDVANKVAIEQGDAVPPRSKRRSSDASEGQKRFRRSGGPLSGPSPQSVAGGKEDVPASRAPDAVTITAEEMAPVTAALREAFGLELFGYDVLVTRGRSRHSGACHNKEHDEENIDDKEKNDQEILVVDVNYFPGYKEVPHFPSLLAQYLTQKAVESRIKNQAS